VDGHCRRFVDSLGCTECECPNCGGDFDLCCTYPGQTNVICVDADACPVP
jgi:hypothetical protein